MTSKKSMMLIAAAVAALIPFVSLAEPELPVSPYAKWEHGLPKDPDFFPIAVWLQQPRNAKRFQDIGINLFIGLYDGPTAEQLADLKRIGMPVICDQNEVGLTDKNNDIIVAWMHGDEPDNAQELANGQGYGPPVDPALIKKNFRKLVEADSSRPVLLNLSMGVAWDGWYGRGVRTNHPEDYPEYMQGCDIVSFDIYPVIEKHPAVAGKLELVPFGVDRLRKWSKGRHIVWNCIECTRISNVDVKPTPAQVRSEVWMALIHGSQGLIYFVHQFKPDFIEAGLLADAEMAKAVGDINRQIKKLAPVLNSPTLDGAVSVTSSDAQVPIDIMVKQDRAATYVFAAAMRNAPAAATFRCEQIKTATVEVLGENRTLTLEDGVFTDEFAPYAVHLYRLQ